LWEEIFLDENDEPIVDPTVKPRQIESIIDNSNLVDSQGVIIDQTNYPKLEEETDEQYEERLRKIEGYPEFDFYIEAVLNKQAIGQAISLLDHLKRFNRS
jgi:hypothetical protein